MLELVKDNDSITLSFLVDNEEVEFTISGEEALDLASDLIQCVKQQEGDFK